MKQYTLISEVKRELRKKKQPGNPVGFVPTMGALHQGHLELIRQSKAENTITVCSIFVNPIQFNNKKDLEKYPRNLHQDLKMLEDAGCDIVFTPEVGEMYPDGTTEAIHFPLGQLEKVMEGRFRPGHFQGVATVVKKLFDIIEPTRAYFGKKDYQQLIVIKELVSRLGIPVEIIACPTVREPDGLAMSSRNLRLTIGERQLAPLIYQVLCGIKEKAGKKSVTELRKWAIKKIEKNPAFRVEYFEIADTRSMVPIERWEKREHAVACTAVYLGDVRLIDNIELFY
jgi:pantoate--beta-alanine ligase